jgi:hypothetical protein
MIDKLFAIARAVTQTVREALARFSSTQRIALTARTTHSDLLYIDVVD